MGIQDVDQLLRKIVRQSRVAIGHMGNEINVVSKGYNACIICRCGSMPKYISVGFVLLVLFLEVFLVRSGRSSALRHQQGKRNVRRISSYFVLEIRSVSEVSHVFPIESKKGPRTDPRLSSPKRRPFSWA